MPHPRNAPNNVSSLTIPKLFNALGAVQVWTLATVLVALVGGAFGLGYRIRSTMADLDASRTGALATSTLALQAKERFLSLYLRYLIALADQQGWPSPSSDRTPPVRDAADSLKSYISALMQRGEEARDEVDVRGLFLSKPPRHDATSHFEATVRFAYDGSVWPVPMQFGFAAKAR